MIKINQETILMNEIKRESSKYAVMFRMNVGAIQTKSGYFRTGVPIGFSDLFGFRRTDGKAIFLEVKTEKGRVSQKQKEFLNAMKNCGAISGVVRSTDEAIKLIKEDF